MIESIYEWCLLKELGLRGLECVSQKFVLIEYKGFTREEPLRFDLLVEACVLVEAKAAAKILPIHKAQLFELHETPQCSRRTTHHFPREKSHLRNKPADPDRS